MKRSPMTEAERFYGLRSLGFRERRALKVARRRRRKRARRP